MLQYLIILLDDTSVSFCHYKNEKTGRSLIPFDVLKEGIKFGMKENLRIQFVLPDYTLPVDYWKEMMSIDHTIIAPGNVDYNLLVPKNVFYHLPDVVCFDDIDAFSDYSPRENQTIILSVDKEVVFSNMQIISDCIFNIYRLNISITDIDSFKEDDFESYKIFMDYLSNSVVESYRKGRYPQVNILTDRMMLENMNNCNAGVSSITLAPDGNFYICPAFYQSLSKTPIRDGFDIGALQDGVKIPNAELYKIEYSPLCKNCDAFQCKRCVWLNNKTTYEVNTPGHEQCVIAHIERNSSRKLLNEFRKETPFFLEGISINEIDYIDPFDVKEEH